MWKLVGFDTFEGRYYSIPSADSETEAEVLQKAAEHMTRIKQHQPDSSSGGQGFGGIQDRLHIKRPDDTMYRYFGQ